MGTAIASRLLEKGFAITVYDIRREAVEVLVARGATAASSSAEVVGRSQLVAIVVDGEDVAIGVAHELIAATGKNTTVVIHTTMRPATVEKLAELARPRQIAIVDASVNGGSEKAILGKMTLMIGGDDDAVRGCRAMFETIAEHLFHVGPAGAGMAGKLVNNMLGVGGYAIQIEAMQLAAAYGLDEDTVTRFVSVSWGDCRHIRTWGRQDRRRRERVAARAGAYERMSRDLLSAVDSGAVRGLQMPMTTAAAEILPIKLHERDAELDRRPAALPIPRCSICNIELAAPYREAGTHPECRPGCS